MKKLINVMFLFCSLFILTQCDLNPSTEVSSSDNKSVFIEKKTVSVKPGETKSLFVTAIKPDGSADTYTAAADNDKAKVTITSTGISVEGTSVGKAIISITSGSGATSVLNVHVYEPLTMDIGNGLLIQFTYKFDNKWDDGGSGGDYNTVWWHPQYDAANGWYPVGSYIRGNYINANKTHAVVLVKDLYGKDLLAKQDMFLPSQVIYCPYRYQNNEKFLTLNKRLVKIIQTMEDFEESALEMEKGGTDKSLIESIRNNYQKETEDIVSAISGMIWKESGAKIEENVVVSIDGMIDDILAKKPEEAGGEWIRLEKRDQPKEGE